MSRLTVLVSRPAGLLVLSKRVRTPGHETDARDIERMISARASRRPWSWLFAHRAVAEAWKWRSRLIEDGLVEAGVRSLRQLADSRGGEAAGRLAAWHLAVWHASSGTQSDAADALRMLAIVSKGRRTLSRMSQYAVVAARCHEILGEEQSASKILERARRSSDVAVARMRMPPDPLDRLGCLNRMMARHGVTPWVLPSTPTGLNEPQALPPLPSQPSALAGTRISVVMVMTSGGVGVERSLLSLREQQHRNLEIVLVDAGASVQIRAIADKAAAEDPRITVVSLAAGEDVVIARNVGLHASTGEFVAYHDQCDWAHPSRILRQGAHLLSRPEILGTTCAALVLDDQLRPEMLPGSGRYLHHPASSLMFRRESALQTAGYWDEVTWGGHLEYLDRLARVHGEKSIGKVTEGPLILRFAAGLPPEAVEHDSPAETRWLGAEYARQYQGFHLRADDVRVGYRPSVRPFPAPAALLAPNSRADSHVDVLLVSDFGLKGGSTQSNLNEIDAQASAGITTGLMQMFHHEGPSRGMRLDVQSRIDGKRVRLVSRAETVSADLVVVRYPPVLNEEHADLARIHTRLARIVVNQPPFSDYGPNRSERYSLPHVDRRATEMFGVRPVWCPIGPLVREALHDHHAEELRGIVLADEDWVNVIDIGEWRRSTRPPSADVVRIGRHSRDHPMKWPATREELLQVYPSSDKYEIRVLGGVRSAQRILGGTPPNWRDYPFNSVSPREFLASLDVFVYFTHPAWVESFGRVILEALASGVPVVTERRYETLFGDAVLYAAPAEVSEVVDSLMSDPHAYERQVSRALEFVENTYGHRAHVERITALIR